MGKNFIGRIELVFCVSAYLGVEYSASVPLDCVLTQIFDGSNCWYFIIIGEGEINFLFL
jgi:hypothetical protein